MVNLKNYKQLRFHHYGYVVNKIDKNTLNKNFPSKIFINRKDGKTKKWRFIINELEVENYLKSAGFKSFTLSDYSFLDQVKLFYHAK